jgi:hypothetical protein
MPLVEMEDGEWGYLAADGKVYMDWDDNETPDACGNCGDPNCWGDCFREAGDARP